MLTPKTALILSRSSSLQGSALAFLVNNAYSQSRCRKHYNSGVYAATSTAAKPGIHGNKLISRGRGTLAQERPDLAYQWDHELNGDVMPDNVQAGSSYIATWRCGKCCEECGKPHLWQAAVSRRTKGLGNNCPLCSGNKVCSCQSLAALRPDLMLEWSDKNSLNPNTLGCFSGQKALWICSKNPEHGSWLATIPSRAGPNATGCPKCANESKRGPRNVRGFVKNEFPEVYAQLLPVPWSLDFLEGLTSGSKRKVWWRCTETQHRPPDCPHEHIWQSSVQTRCLRSSGCPFCSGQCVCPCDSIAGKAQGMLGFWHFEKNTEMSPERVGIHSHRKVWWRHICPTTREEHEWQAVVSDTYKAYMLDERLGGRGEHRIPCPICSKRIWKERIREGNQQIRKGLSAT